MLVAKPDGKGGGGNDLDALSTPLIPIPPPPYSEHLSAHALSVPACEKREQKKKEKKEEGRTDSMVKRSTKGSPLPFPRYRYVLWPMHVDSARRGEKKESRTAGVEYRKLSTAPRITLSSDLLSSIYDFAISQRWAQGV